MIQHKIKTFLFHQLMPHSLNYCPHSLWLLLIKRQQG